MMTDLCTDVGHVSMNKHGEQLCGDHVEVIPGDRHTVAVLADGLGSGVKASILSTLTSKILSTMIASRLPVEECVETIAATLPICKERGIAYSTFTIISVNENHEAEIIQYDNPRVILLRNGKSWDYPETTELIGDKRICKTRISIGEGDVFVALSDGVVHAGIGRSLNFGWQRRDIVSYLEGLYHAGFTAKTISSILLEKCYNLYGGAPGDDATVCTVKIRRRRPINLLIGPPVNPRDAMKMMALFFAKGGKHIVCGGTSSALAAEFLKKSLETGNSKYEDPEIPPTAKIEGVDLVTEGVITIHRVLEYARDYLKSNEQCIRWNTGKDGASQITRLLFEEATDINFYVGKAINPAHQNPGLPIGFSIKMRLIDELAACLREMGKQIKVSYF
ncbi:MAG: serine/threonine-protein phosphatase [Treponema sp.]|jgi:hypothetical protein|nr:serine/threonine-protein phosphatase [Treponema sp.]